jgi:deazaflavin-dependent oxidoreductase (nitroreductase family)
MDIREVNTGVIEKFRVGEDPPGMHRDRLLLLTTTGARTGRPHTCPMMFHYTPASDSSPEQDGSAERILVIASANAAPDDPQWYRNLLADPKVHVEMPDESFDATAIVLDGEDYAQEWREIKAFYPFFAEHEAKVDRPIPVVELRRD